jgi:hypothetical protein
MRRRGARGENATFTVHEEPSVTSPVQVLLLARVKSRLGAPWVRTLMDPRVPSTVTW